jgi:hypothetical protein
VSQAIQCLLQSCQGHQSIFKRGQSGTIVTLFFDVYHV